jgi:hypothetical protein
MTDGKQAVADRSDVTGQRARETICRRDSEQTAQNDDHTDQHSILVGDEHHQAEDHERHKQWGDHHCDDDPELPRERP